MTVEFRPRITKKDYTVTLNGTGFMVELRRPIRVGYAFPESRAMNFLDLIVENVAERLALTWRARRGPAA